MKQISVFTFFLAIPFVFYAMDHSPNYLMFDTSRMPFVFDPGKADTLDDTNLNYRVDTKALMILIAEMQRIAQTRYVPAFYELIERIKNGTIKLDHEFCRGHLRFFPETLVTQKDIEGRLLSHIRVFGTCGITTEQGKYHHIINDGRRIVPIILGTQIALLHHTANGPRCNTQLWDASSFAEITSQNYDDCRKRVETILEKYQR